MGHGSSSGVHSGSGGRLSLGMDGSRGSRGRAYMFALIDTGWSWSSPATCKVECQFSERHHAFIITVDVLVMAIPAVLAGGPRHRCTA